MVIWQADPNFNNGQHLADARSWDAYPAYVDALRNETSAFAGQVVLVHGDRHYFKLDKPINGADGGGLANFTRVETFGARNTHWVSARIDPNDPNVFAFRAANRRGESIAAACRTAPPQWTRRITWMTRFSSYGRIPCPP